MGSVHMRVVRGIALDFWHKHIHRIMQAGEDIAPKHRLDQREYCHCCRSASHPPMWSTGLRQVPEPSPECGEGPNLYILQHRPLAQAPIERGLVAQQRRLIGGDPGPSPKDLAPMHAQHLLLLRARARMPLGVRNAMHCLESARSPNAPQRSQMLSSARSLCACARDRCIQVCRPLTPHKICEDVRVNDLDTAALHAHPMLKE